MSVPPNQPLILPSYIQPINTSTRTHTTNTNNMEATSQSQLIRLSNIYQIDSTSAPDNSDVTYSTVANYIRDTIQYTRCITSTSNQYIAYSIKNSSIRIINQLDGKNVLLKGHTGNDIIDLQFCSTHYNNILCSVTSTDCMVWKLATVDGGIQYEIIKHYNDTEVQYHGCTWSQYNNTTYLLLLHNHSYSIHQHNFSSDTLVQRNVNNVINVEYGVKDGIVLVDEISDTVNIVVLTNINTVLIYRLHTINSDSIELIHTYTLNNHMYNRIFGCVDSLLLVNNNTLRLYNIHNSSDKPQLSSTLRLDTTNYKYSQVTTDCSEEYVCIVFQAKQASDKSTDHGCLVIHISTDTQHHSRFDYIQPIFTHQSIISTTFELIDINETHAIQLTVVTNKRVEHYEIKQSLFQLPNTSQYITEDHVIEFDDNDISTPPERDVSPDIIQTQSTPTKLNNVTQSLLNNASQLLSTPISRPPATHSSNHARDHSMTSMNSAPTPNSTPYVQKSVTNNIRSSSTNNDFSNNNDRTGTGRVNDTNINNNTNTSTSDMKTPFNTPAKPLTSSNQHNDDSNNNNTTNTSESARQQAKRLQEDTLLARLDKLFTRQFTRVNTLVENSVQNAVQQSQQSNNNKTAQTIDTSAITQVIKNELVQVLVPVIGKTIHKLNNDVVVPAINHTLHEQLTQLNQNQHNNTDNMIDIDYNVLSSNIVNQIQHIIQDTVKQTIQNKLIPPFENSARVMFTQISSTFDRIAAQQESLLQSQSTSLTAMSDVNTESTNNQIIELKNIIKSLAQHTAVLTKTIHDIQVTQSNQSNTLNEITNSLQQQSITSNTNTFSAAAPTTPSHPHVQPHTHTRSESYLSQSSSSVVQAPVPSDPRDQIQQLLLQQRYNDSFRHALSMNDIEVVVWLCTQFDPRQLLSTTNKLHQLNNDTLLSLIQQLTYELTNHTILKLTWCKEIVLQYAEQLLSDHVLIQHVYNVLRDTVQHIDVQLQNILRNSNDPLNELTRTVRSLIVGYTKSSTHPPPPQHNVVKSPYSYK